ncbi:MAG: phosphopantetheine-binding protein [Eisenbergiella sp.]
MAGSEESPVLVKTQPENGRLEAVQNAAGNGLEDRLLRIWSVILGREDLSPDISFFEQGGTSLGALSVLEQVF